MDKSGILNDAYQLLEAVYSNCALGDAVMNDRVASKEGWIINKDEEKAIQLVLSLLKDCGAEDAAEEAERIEKEIEA